MKELDLQKNIRNGLIAIGHKCWQVDSGKKITQKTRGFGLEKGFPDLFGCRMPDRQMFFIEVKKPDGKLSDDQKAFLISAYENKIVCGVARNLVEAIELLKGERTLLDDINKEELQTWRERNE